MPAPSAANIRASTKADVGLSFASDVLIAIFATGDLDGRSARGASPADRA